MKRVLIAGLALVCLPTVAVAQTAPKPLADFTSLCEEEDGTGFNWENGTWKRTLFTQEKWIVRKVQPSTSQTVDDDTTNFCLPRLREEDAAGTELAWAAACYSISRLGERQFSGWCTEFFDKVGATWVVSQISCKRGIGKPEFAFLPSGPFQYSSFHGVVDVKPKGGAKDSLKVSHGKCSVIQ